MKQLFGQYQTKMFNVFVKVMKRLHLRDKPSNLLETNFQLWTLPMYWLFSGNDNFFSLYHSTSYWSKYFRFLRNHRNTTADLPLTIHVCHDKYLRRHSWKILQAFQMLRWYRHIFVSLCLVWIDQLKSGIRNELRNLLTSKKKVSTWYCRLVQVKINGAQWTVSMCQKVSVSCNIWMLGLIDNYPNRSAFN